MQQAVDRSRFRRRIKQIELALGDIFSDKHRDKVKRRQLFCANREKVKRCSGPALALGELGGRPGPPILGGRQIVE
jgi:hypothetical protein